MKCRNCNKEISSENKFCPYCGSKVFYICPKCGHKLDEKFQFCGNCGHNLIKKEVEEENKTITPIITKPVVSGNNLITNSRDKIFPFNLIICIFALLTILVTTICILSAPLLESVAYLSLGNGASNLSDNAVYKIFFGDIISSQYNSFPDYYNPSLGIGLFIIYGFVFAVFSIFTIVSCIIYMVKKDKLNTHGILGFIISNIYLLFFFSVFSSEFDRRPHTLGLLYYNFKIQFSSGLNTILAFTLILFIMIAISKLFIQTDVEYSGVKVTSFICCLLLIVIPLFTISNQYVITSKIIADYKFSFSTPILVGSFMIKASGNKTGSTLDSKLTFSTMMQVIEFIIDLVLLGLLLCARTRKRRAFITVLIVFSLIFHLVSATIFEEVYFELRKQITSIVFTPDKADAIALNNFSLSVNTPHIVATIIYISILILNIVSLFFPLIKKEDLKEYDLVTQ